MSEKSYGAAYEGTGWIIQYALGHTYALQQENIHLTQAVACSGGLIPACTALLKLDALKVKNTYQDIVAAYGHQFLLNIPRAIDILIKEVLSGTNKEEFVAQLDGKLIIKALKLPFFHPYFFKKWKNWDDFYNYSCAASSLPFISPFPRKIASKHFVDGFLGGKRMIKELSTDKKIIISWLDYSKIKLPYLFLKGFVQDESFGNEMFENGYNNARIGLKNLSLF